MNQLHNDNSISCQARRLNGSFQTAAASASCNEIRRAKCSNHRSLNRMDDSITFLLGTCADICACCFVAKLITVGISCTAVIERVEKVGCYSFLEFSVGSRKLTHSAQCNK